MCLHFSLKTLVIVAIWFVIDWTESDYFTHQKSIAPGIVEK